MQAPQITARPDAVQGEGQITLARASNNAKGRSFGDRDAYGNVWETHCRPRVEAEHVVPQPRTRCSGEDGAAEMGAALDCFYWIGHAEI